MKITLADKKLIEKPQKNEEWKYFKGLLFKTGDFSLNTFEKIIKNGYTITYIYKDDVFSRADHYMTYNYYGTQFICVDVDKCEISPLEFVKTLKYKPTYIHTTFSNLTPQKENKYCFHLIYCFDDIIRGEDNFHTVFNILTEDYIDYVDKCAKDCHRVIFTSNGTLDNFELYKEDIIYKVKDFFPKPNNKEFDEIDTLFNQNDYGKNLQNAYIFNKSNNIQDNEKNFPNEKQKKIGNNTFELDETFWVDLNTLTRSNFLDKYLDIYPYITCSIAEQDQLFKTENGIYYEDWRNREYYEVPSKYRYNNGQRRIQKVGNGNRTKSLMFDCLMFIKVIPNITKEYLITMLVNEVYKHYDNKDNELTNYKLVGIAKYGWDLKDNINVNPLKKKFKIVFTESMRKNAAVGVLNKLMKDDEIGNNLDLSISLEDNIKEFKNNGIKITKQRLVQFCNEYNVTLLTDKEIKYNKVLELHNENKDLSSRKLEELCKQKGIKISYRTIQTIINKN